MSAPPPPSKPPPRSITPVQSAPTPAPPPPSQPLPPQQQPIVSQSAPPKPPGKPMNKPASPAPSRSGSNGSSASGPPPPPPPPSQPVASSVAAPAPAPATAPAPSKPPPKPPGGNPNLIQKPDPATRSPSVPTSSAAAAAPIPAITTAPTIIPQPQPPSAPKPPKPMQPASPASTGSTTSSSANQGLVSPPAPAPAALAPHALSPSTGTTLGGVSSAGAGGFLPPPMPASGRTPPTKTPISTPSGSTRSIDSASLVPSPPPPRGPPSNKPSPRPSDASANNKPSPRPSDASAQPPTAVTPPPSSLSAARNETSSSSTAAPAAPSATNTQIPDAHPGRKLSDAAPSSKPAWMQANDERKAREAALAANVVIGAGAGSGMVAKANHAVVGEDTVTDVAVVAAAAPPPPVVEVAPVTVSEPVVSNAAAATAADVPVISEPNFSPPSIVLPPAIVVSPPIMSPVQDSPISTYISPTVSSSSAAAGVTVVPAPAQWASAPTGPSEGMWAQAAETVSASSPVYVTRAQLAAPASAPIISGAERAEALRAASFAATAEGGMMLGAGANANTKVTINSSSNSFAAPSTTTPLTPLVEEALVAREMREVYARYSERRAALLERVSDARDRLLAVQKALRIATAAAEEAGAANSETRALEAAVARAGERVAVMRAALRHDEVSLAGRLTSQAARVRTLRDDADAAAAALAAAHLEAEAAASARVRPGEVDLASLTHALNVAKSEQLEALGRAAEAEFTAMNKAQTERASALAETAAQAESTLVALRKEEGALSDTTIALGEALNLRRGEAQAAVARRHALVIEVEALRDSLRAAEASDAARLREMADEVSRLEQQTALLRAAPETLTVAADGALVSTPGVPAALAAAEVAAREAERARWATLLEEARVSGERGVENVRAAGRARYKELVLSIEQRYVSEFESALAEIHARQGADAGEARALEARLGSLHEQVAAARGERARLDNEAAGARARAAGEAESKRERLAELQASLRRLWNAEGGVEPVDAAAFLRRVMSLVPYSPAVASLYDNKLGELRATAPILRGVSRREVLLFRLEHLRKAATELDASAMLGLSRGAPDAPSATARRESELTRVRAEFTSTNTELTRVNESLARDITGYEATRGKHFIYKGLRLLPLLMEGVPVASAGLAAMTPRAAALAASAAVVVASVGVPVPNFMY